MKKVGIVSFASLLILGISSLTAYFLRYAPKGAVWVYPTVGIALLVLSAIFALLARKRIAANAVLCAVNAVALGFLIRAWYILRGFDNPLWMMLLVSLAAVAYLWVFYALARARILRRHAKAFTVIFVLLSLVGYATVVFTTKTTFVSTFGYYMVLELAFIFAMCRSTAEPAELVRAITVSTYTLFAVAIFVAVMALLGDGDLDVDLDFDLDLDGVDGVDVGLEALGETVDGVVSVKRDKKSGRL